MSKSKAIRAWKDPEYRNSLSAAELAAMPAHPAGMKELSDADLQETSGGIDSIFTFCPTQYTCLQPTCCNKFCSINLQCPGRSVVPK